MSTSCRALLIIQSTGIATDHTHPTSRGYRIRALTDAEKEVKVSQLVGRQREWEDGLVGVYKKFLETCENEITGPGFPSPLRGEF